MIISIVCKKGENAVSFMCIENLFILVYFRGGARRSREMYIEIH